MLPTVKGTTQTALTCCLWPWQGLLSQQRSPCFIFSLISPLSSSLRRRARARSILGFRQLPKQSCSLPFQASSYGNRSRVGAFGTEHRGIEYNSRAQVHSDDSGVWRTCRQGSNSNAVQNRCAAICVPQTHHSPITPIRMQFARIDLALRQHSRVCHWCFLFQFCTQIWTHLCVRARAHEHTHVRSIRV